MILNAIKTCALAIACMIASSGAALAQAPDDHGAWPDRDAQGRRSPMPFALFHGQRLTFDRVVQVLNAAGCKREEAETFIRFDCEAEPNQWYLTKPGTLEHPGLAVPADKEGGAPTSPHTRPLTDASLTPEARPPEKREAFALWTEALPLRTPRPELAAMKPTPVDYAAIYANSPLTRAQMQGPTALNFADVVKTLEAAAGCKRETGETYVSFDCASSKTRWYITRDGQAAHPSLILKAGRTYAGATVDDPYMSLVHKPFPPEPGRTRPMVGGDDAIWSWAETLPGFVKPPPLRINLANSPFTEQDIRPTGPRGQSLTHDSATQKLVAAGCARKDVGEYLAYACKGSDLIFVLSAPASPAHPSFAIAEASPNGGEVQSAFGQTLGGGAGPRAAFTEERSAAFRKWSRGIDYLQISQLR